MPQFSLRSRRAAQRSLHQLHAARFAPLLVLALCLTACGWPQDHGAAANLPELTIEGSMVDQDEFQINDVVESQGSLVALASTRDQRAGSILRSDDGGLSWSQVPSPLGDAIPGFDPYCSGEDDSETRLIVAGAWVVALRSDTYELDICTVVRRQAVAISGDRGRTWQLVDLPVPENTAPRV